MVRIANTTIVTSYGSIGPFSNRPNHYTIFWEGSSQGFSLPASSQSGLNPMVHTIVTIMLNKPQEYKTIVVWLYRKTQMDKSAIFGMFKEIYL